MKSQYHTVLGLLLFASAAEAHPLHNNIAGFMDGFNHPFSGVDHLLAMLAVGIYAVQRGGRALWALPTSFVVAMAAGVTACTLGMTLPFIGMGVACTVVLLGMLVATGARLSAVVSMVLIAACGFYHGFAHGGQLAMATSAISYGAGMLMATAMLHAVGIFSALRLYRLRHSELLRIAGISIASVGLVLISGT